MFARAAAIIGTERDMSDNVGDFFDSLVGIVRDFGDIADRWGEPFNVLVPLLVAAIVVLAFFNGIGWVFGLAVDKVKPIFVFVLLIFGVLLLAAITSSEESTLAPTEPVPVPVAVSR